MMELLCFIYMYLIYILVWNEVSFYTNAAIIAPASEIALMLSAVIVINIIINNNIIKIFIKVISVLYFIVYIASCYYYYYSSGEWISELAISNINQVYLLLNYKYYTYLFIFVLMSALFYYLINKIKYTNAKLRISIIMSLISIISIVSFNKGIILVNHVYQTPVVTAVKNTYKYCISSEHINSVDDYIFEKDYVYNNDVISEKKELPNIIIIFTEGTSARLMGCYGGEYGDITPNIDNMSKEALIVDNYYNHTAATFRGILGQLTSAYIYHGGSENGGWVVNAKNLKERNYSTLPGILNAMDYQTVFLSPHATEDPYTELLKTCEFKHIYTRDNIDSLLNYVPDFFHQSIKDEDMYSALKALLENKNDDPLFLCMYTFDTHLGVELPDGAEEYSYNGKSVESLNSLHNLDKQFGIFWNWFKKSKFAKNTIVIFTADHAHYNEISYVKLVEKDGDYTSCFIDKIPLIIYDPLDDLRGRYNANDSTSLALAPTVLNLLCKNNIVNAFMGSSIFDTVDSIHTAATGNVYYHIYNHKVYDSNNIPNECIDIFNNDCRKIEEFYNHETFNMMIRK